MSTFSITPAPNKAEALSSAPPKPASDSYSDKASVAKRTPLIPFQERDQPQGQCLCSYRSGFCADQTPCQVHGRAHIKNTSPTVATKPWRVAFLPEHHHPYHHQQETLRFSKPVSHPTQTSPGRLSSGSACETCRRRKTKCDGGQPCAYCSVNSIQCKHRPARKRSHYHLGSSNQSGPPEDRHLRELLKSVEPRTIMKQASCPSFKVAQSSVKSVSPPTTPPPTDKCSVRPIDGGFSNEKMPSITDQLSCRTFSAITMAAFKPTPGYPIYPVIPPTPPSSVNHADI